MASKQHVHEGANLNRVHRAIHPPHDEGGEVGEGGGGEVKGQEKVKEWGRCR